MRDAVAGRLAILHHMRDGRLTQRWIADSLQCTRRRNRVKRPILAIDTCFQQERNFSGRASRWEFWWFLPLAILAVLVGGIASLIHLFPLLVIIWIIDLIEILPALSAVTVRRLHDANRTGWWALLPAGACLAGIIAGPVWASDFFGRMAFAIFGGVSLGVLGFLPLLIFLVRPTHPTRTNTAPTPSIRREMQAATGMQPAANPCAPPPPG